MMRAPLLLSVLLLSAGAAAQSVPVAPTYRVGLFNSEWQACPSQGLSFLLTDATLTFDGSGGLSFTYNDVEVCPGGSVVTDSGSGAGTYMANPEGTLTLDFDPSNPGQDTSLFAMRADGSFGTSGRDRCITEGGISVMVALSSGQSNASLQGEYFFTRLTGRNTPGGSASVAERGVMVFDGAGGYTEGGMRHVLQEGGSTVSTTIPAAAGTYVVAADGSLTAGAGTGAMTADRMAFFWVTDASSAGDVSLTVGVRKAASYSASRMRADYRFTHLAFEIGGEADVIVTDYGYVEARPTGLLGGSLEVALTLVATSSILYQECVNEEFSDTFSITRAGEVMLGGGPDPQPGALSADGTILLAIDRESEATGMLIAVAACAEPRLLLPGTSGTGGRTPALATSGGLPRIGNGAFAYEVSSGVPNGVGVLWLTLGTMPPLSFLGGVFHVNVASSIGTFPMVLSPSGQATLPFALPRRSAWAGIDIGAQAFVVDANAPQMFSMSPGLEFRVCR